MMRRVVAAGVVVLLLIGGLALGGVLSPDNREHSTRVSTEEARGPSRTTDEPSPKDESEGLSGSFKSATAVPGYTVRASYDIPKPLVEVDVANAKPGEARVVARPAASLTIRNTTDQRNTQVGIATFSISLMWSERSLPQQLRSFLLADEGPDARPPCHTVFREDRFCTLAAVGFEPENTTLDPEGETQVSAITPGLSGGYTFPEDDGQTAADFINRSAPDLVAVFHDRFSPEHLTWSCALTRMMGVKPVDDPVLAILGGGGDALIDGGGYAVDPGNNTVTVSNDTIPSCA